MTDAKEPLGRIGVLMGGCSSERDISLKSGKAVDQALREAGCDVVPMDLTTVDGPEIVALLQAEKIDIAFIALHGKFGEDGAIQTILENAGVAYTGAGPEASRLAINKISTQSLLDRSGVSVPACCIFPDGAEEFDDVRNALGGAVVVKPACEGSSIGITVVKEARDFPAAVALARQYGPDILIERYIPGREITAGILAGEALPLVEIIPRSGFFDFTAKYQKGLTEYLAPAPLDSATTQKIQRMAVTAFEALGCRDMGRVDFILDKNNNPFVLEVNTIPGFTATSLLPMAAQRQGYSFTDLCLKIAGFAAARRAASSLHASRDALHG